MLRLLATYDIVKCSSNTKENGEVERLYAPGPICKFLTKNKNGSGSAAPLLLLHHDEVFMKSWMEHVADMFKSVPKGDAIILKWVLHDWNDDLCLKLLKNCWEALPSNGKVIVVESILPTVPENNVTSQVLHKEDLMLLSFNVGGKERTRQEFEALASKSGFSSCEFICCAYNSWVIEFHK
ncbi:hypothetical protein GH714_014150 [Hevea brasiliensis]|uniref:O-methyltransferase C-terminal domain-containing protein n=1 Tax=Hevea brasiliensis TaxID=3981 RepID=A0A6A6KNG6_HEVBR|nr:hypothetical protein GH714_014150 [Hevea brasiliensis]